MECAEEARAKGVAIIFPVDASAPRSVEERVRLQQLPLVNDGLSRVRVAGQ